MDEYSGLTGRKGTTVVSVTSVLWFWVASHTATVQWGKYSSDEFCNQAPPACVTGSTSHLRQFLSCPLHRKRPWQVLQTDGYSAKIKRSFFFSSSNNREETKWEDEETLLSYRLELLLRSFGKLWQIQAALGFKKQEERGDDFVVLHRNTQNYKTDTHLFLIHQTYALEEKQEYNCISERKQLF